MKLVVTAMLSVLVAGCNLIAPPDAKPLELLATKDFKVNNEQGYSFYVDKPRNVLAINAGQPNLRNVYVQANSQIPADFVSAKYDVTLTTMTEIDGESSYQLFVNNGLVSTVTNPETDKEFAYVTLDVGELALSPGDKITVSSIAVTNGKIPEGDITAYARGRWQKLTFTPAN